MDELTREQATELETALVTLRDELKQLIESTRDGTRPVDLDEPIGRLTRMDAIQQQSMATANRRSHGLRLQFVQQALSLVERGEYGSCRKCEDPIGYPRLRARPESPYCLACQEEIDERH